MQRNTKVFSLPKQWEKLGEDIAKGEASKFEPGDSLTVSSPCPIWMQKVCGMLPNFVGLTIVRQMCQVGSWIVEQMGGQIVIANKHSKRQRLLLQVDGFTFLGSVSKGLVVKKVPSTPLFTPSEACVEEQTSPKFV